MTPVAESLRSLAGAILAKQDVVESGSRLAGGVAEALEWNSGLARVEPLAALADQASLARAFLGAQPAALFAGTLSDQNDGLLSEVANFAYHTSIDWGVIATPRDALIFNSHWVRQRRWFRLPTIIWENIEGTGAILSAVTPMSVGQGRLERLAAAVYEPEDILLRVDDALVERLDYWRSEGVRFAAHPGRIDQDLQTLFSQLFILRAIEDRGLAPDIPSLETVLSASKDMVAELRGIFHVARNLIQSQLFDDSSIVSIPARVLAGVIGDLYVPKHLPGDRVRYNFAWIDADVLGRAYEKYLSTVLAPATVPPQLRLFDQPLRGVAPISVQKASGVYYTPSYVVRHLVERSLEEVLPSGGDNPTIPRVVDFASGSGSFLVAAADSLIRRLRSRDPTRNWARELVDGKFIVGVDVDEGAVRLTRQALWLRFAEEPNPLPLPRLAEVVVHGDALLPDTWRGLPTDYDVVLGNPPFLASAGVPNRESLAAQFASAQGRFDYSSLFIELAVQKLRPGGMLSMVVPNRVFRNRDAAPLRQVLTSDIELISLTDFGSAEVFPGTSAYIGTITGRKRTPGVPTAASVRVIRVTALAPNFMAAVLMMADRGSGELTTDYLLAFDWPQPRGSAPWLLLAPSERGARLRLEERSIELSSIAAVRQGIKTGANDVFILELESSREEELVFVRNGLGDSALIESALVHPVTFGSDIQRYDIVAADRVVLYPYALGAVIPEVELREGFPKTYDYLQQYRDFLAERGSVQAGNLRWYELVRARHQAWLDRPKLLIRDLTSMTSFALDASGQTYIVGGTAVVPEDAELLMPLLAYLNSSVANEYLRQVTPVFRGGFQKVEPQHLSRLPVPMPIAQNTDLAARLGELARVILAAHERKDERAQQDAEELVERLLREALAQMPQEDLS